MSRPDAEQFVVAILALVALTGTVSGVVVLQSQSVNDAGNYAAVDVRTNGNSLLLTMRDRPQYQNWSQVMAEAKQRYVVNVVADGEEYMVGTEPVGPDRVMWPTDAEPRPNYRNLTRHVATLPLDHRQLDTDSVTVRVYDAETGVLLYEDGHQLHGYDLSLERELNDSYQPKTKVPIEVHVETARGAPVAWGVPVTVTKYKVMNDSWARAHNGSRLVKLHQKTKTVSPDGSVKWNYRTASDGGSKRTKDTLTDTNRRKIVIRSPYTGHEPINRTIRIEEAEE